MGNEEIKKEKSQKYFADLTRVNCTQNQTGNADDLNEKIALRVSLSNIHKDSGYSVQLFNTAGGMNSPLCQPDVPALLTDIDKPFSFAIWRIMYSAIGERQMFPKQINKIFFI